MVYPESMRGCCGESGLISSPCSHVSLRRSPALVVALSACLVDLTLVRRLRAVVVRRVDSCGRQRMQHVSRLRDALSLWHTSIVAGHS